MKITNKQLKKIIAEELRLVLREFMITPFDAVEIGLKDPKVDKRIKGLLRQDDPQLQQQGVELLAVMYPEEYGKQIDSYEGSEEYKKRFADRTKMAKDITLVRELQELMKNIPGNIEIEFRNRGKAHIASRDLDDLNFAIELLKKMYGFKFPAFSVSQTMDGMFLADFTTGIPFKTSALATLPYGEK